MALLQVAFLLENKLTQQGLKNVIEICHRFSGIMCFPYPDFQF